MAYGTVNADVIQSSVANTSLGAGNSSAMKNRIINGAMMVAQRGTGSTTNAAATNFYPVDRFYCYGDAASKFSGQQNAGSVTPPAGFINYLVITSLSSYSVPTGELYIIDQPIEGLNVSDLGWGTANAKTVTLSFQVYSSLTGTFGGALRNSAHNRSYPFSYTISSANTWTSISITIAGDTSGTWLTTNGIGIEVDFGLGVGSTYSGTAGSWAGANYLSSTGATSVVGTNGATFYITGVQLEVGSSATGFEYRQYGQELALCYRYYYSYVSSTNKCIGTGHYYSSTELNLTLQFPVTMRTIPSLVAASGTDFYIAYKAGGNDTFNSWIAQGGSPNSICIYNASEASGTQGQAYQVWTSASNTGSVAFNSEL